MFNIQANIISKELLNDVVNLAINTFNDSEKYLMENDLSERCICSRFAMHLTNALKNKGIFDYEVDVEYNRGADGYERGTKRIDDKPITVDLIVHKRGYDSNYGFNNLICVEMKKSTDRRGCTADEERLQKMVSYDYGFCYKSGFMIIVNMNPNAFCLQVKERYFLKGY